MPDFDRVGIPFSISAVDVEYSLFTASIWIIDRQIKLVPVFTPPDPESSVADVSDVAAGCHVEYILPLSVDRHIVVAENICGSLEVKRRVYFRQSIVSHWGDLAGIHKCLAVFFFGARIRAGSVLVVEVANEVVVGSRPSKLVGDVDKERARVDVALVYHLRFYDDVVEEDLEDELVGFAAEELVEFGLPDGEIVPTRGAVHVSVQLVVRIVEGWSDDSDSVGHVRLLPDGKEAITEFLSVGARVDVEDVLPRRRDPIRAEDFSGDLELFMRDGSCQTSASPGRDLTGVDEGLAFF